MRRVLTSLAVIAAAVAVGWALGVRVDGHMSAGDLVVGAGTAALAYFTWNLAKQTRADVATSGESVRLARLDIELSRRSLQAADMPYVIPAPAPVGPARRIAPEAGMVVGGRVYGIYLGTDERESWLAIRLWNLGKGPAIVKEVGMLSGPTRVLEKQVGQMPIAPGAVRDEELLCVRSTVVPPDRLLRGELWIDYLHSDGSEWRTECDVTMLNGLVSCETFRRIQVDAVLSDVSA